MTSLPQYVAQSMSDQRQSCACSSPQFFVASPSQGHSEIPDLEPTTPIFISTVQPISDVWFQICSVLCYPVSERTSEAPVTWCTHLVLEDVLRNIMCTHRSLERRVAEHQVYSPVSWKMYFSNTRCVGLSEKYSAFSTNAFFISSTSDMTTADVFPS